MSNLIKIKAGTGRSKLISCRLKMSDYLLYQKLCNENNLTLSIIPRNAIINFLNKTK
jgi:hypothetical protein